MTGEEDVDRGGDYTLFQCGSVDLIGGTTIIILIILLNYQCQLYIT